MPSRLRFQIMIAIVMLLGLAGCQMIEPPGETQLSPLVTPARLSPVSPLETPVHPSPVPTDPEDVKPTLAPTSTPPPVPTPLPTPVVTPIPTAVPPIIPEVVGKAQQPFWIIYWKGNEIWRIDDQGKERQLLLDTYKRLGQWLTDIPDPYKDTDCCWIGPRVVVSPDGQKLALVVVDKIKGTKDDRFTFSIHVFDIRTDNLKLLSQGALPVWSPNGRRIAFLREGGLWIADLETWQVRERIAAHKDPNMHITEFAWSPDSREIAYLYNFSMQRLSTTWAINADSETPPRQLFSLEGGYPIYGITWSPDGQRMFFLSMEGGRDTSSYHRVQNLWAVSLATGARMPLTQDMEVQSYGISPDKKWLFIAGYPLYERSKKNYDRDLWLLSIDGKDLRRITADQGDLAVAGWSPDGTRLVVWRAKADPLLLSLDNRITTASNLDLSFDYEVGGGK